MKTHQFVLEAALAAGFSLFMILDEAEDKKEFFQPLPDNAHEAVYAVEAVRQCRVLMRRGKQAVIVTIDTEQEDTVTKYEGVEV